MNYIYALVDPFTGEVRYIGKSIHPRQRLTAHCNEHSGCHRTNWIQTVIARGQRPGLRILESLPDDADWQAAERRWIAHARAEGWPLTNGTDGGDGVTNLPPESRQRITDAWIGRKHSPETLVKIGKASRGRKHTEEHKARMRQVFADRQFSLETRGRISLGVSKLTPDEVREIRRLIAQGETQRKIAKRFGVDQKTICNINRGRFYREVE